jgi:dipeptidyl-peptidase-3
MSADPYLLQSGFEIGDLHPEKTIAALTPEQLKYATYLSLSTWAGFPILAAQTSRDAPAIHDFLSAFIRTYPRDALEAAASQPGTPLFHLLEYAAQFYCSGAQYFGMGDLKFIPAVSQPDLLALCEPHPALAAKLAAAVDAIYSRAPPLLNLGFAPSGTTAYYEPDDFTREEQQGVDALLKQARISPNNTVIVREPARYNVAQFSVDVDDAGTRIGEFNGLPVVVTKGRFSAVLRTVNHWLALAKASALSPIEAEALEHLIRHNQTGDVNEHILYSELWVRDSDPVVETYQGVIECSRDPSGVRCEYEGFVAAVDPQESRFLHAFVAAADRILPLLPYPKEYERDAFVPPSYNALNILTFCVSGMPIGINIPNYDEIRLSKGFKNVLRSMSVTESQLPDLIANWTFGMELSIARVGQAPEEGGRRARRAGRSTRRGRPSRGGSGRRSRSAARRRRRCSSP